MAFQAGLPHLEGRGHVPRIRHVLSVALSMVVAGLVADGGDDVVMAARANAPNVNARTEEVQPLDTDRTLLQFGWRLAFGRSTTPTASDPLHGPVVVAALDTRTQKDLQLDSACELVSPCRSTRLLKPTSRAPVYPLVVAIAVCPSSDMLPPQWRALERRSGMMPRRCAL